MRCFGIAAALAFAATLGVLAQQTGDRRPARCPSDQRPALRPGDVRRGAAWLDRPERIEEEEPDRALDVLRIPKGAVVADVGAGSGYFTAKLSSRVGPAGKVYAVDIQPEMLRLLGLRLKKDNITNVTLVPGEVDNPRLPASTLDLELMVDVYHDFRRRRRC